MGEGAKSKYNILSTTTQHLIWWQCLQYFNGNTCAYVLLNAFDSPKFLKIHLKWGYFAPYNPLNQGILHGKCKDNEGWLNVVYEFYISSQNNQLNDQQYEETVGRTDIVTIMSKY